MRHIDADRVFRLLASFALLFWAALPAFADSALAPQRPTLDPPAITAGEPTGAARRASAAALDVVPYSHGNPTAEEQFMLEFINRARANPTAEGLRLRTTTDANVLAAYAFFQVNVDKMASEFASYPARPPLAFNPNLIAAARGHSQDMAAHDFQGHTGSDGSTFAARISSAGYTEWTAIAENVFAYAQSVFHGHAGFNADWGVPGLGHRQNIMNFTLGGPVYTEIGIGILSETSPGKSVGPLVVTEDFGTRADGQRFVVGVVYRDDDRNGFYGIGEGIGGILVSTSQGNFAYTSASGGYAIPLTSASSGSITVWAEGAGLGAPQERSVLLSGVNVKADFVAATGAAAALAVSRAGGGAGTVTSNPAGIACGTDCTETYAVNASITLVATPSAGSAFSGWSGACTGTRICTVSMSTSRTVTATFTLAGAGSANANQWVQKAYVAYYGRPADPSGLSYWASRMDAEGGSLASIIAAFGASDEFNRRYGGLSYSQLIDTLYQQTLGRAPDAAGKQWYLEQLNAGKTTLQTITLDLLGGATGSDALTVANRLDVANHYTGKVAAGCSYGNELTGVASLAAVTPDSATVWSAKTAIENRCGM